jgi:hypothetical protein
MCLRLACCFPVRTCDRAGQLWRVARAHRPGDGWTCRDSDAHAAPGQAAPCPVTVSVRHPWQGIRAISSPDGKPACSADVFGSETVPYSTGTRPRGSECFTLRLDRPTR